MSEVDELLAHWREKWKPTLHEHRLMDALVEAMSYELLDDRMVKARQSRVAAILRGERGQQ